MSGITRYPSFNVLDEKDAWDDHTQQIVTSRSHSIVKYQFLNEREVEILRCLCSLLVDDSLPDSLEFIISHIDQTLYSSPGEGQRKVGVPAAPELIRQGLEAMEKSSQHIYSISFAELEIENQKKMINDISEDKAESSAIWNGVPQKALFEKLMRLTVEAYCSHPQVWSDIGYAGPAYPRGYVRTQLGQLDPWEANTENEA